VGNDELDANGNLKNPWAVDYSKLVPELVLGWQAHERDIKDLASAVASATSTISVFMNSSTTPQSIVTSVLGELKADIVNGVTHFIELAVDTLRTKKLAVGNASAPSGITIYDEDTGAPYCFKIKSGATLSIPGECGSVQTPIYNQPEVIPTTSPITDSSTATTTDSVATTTPQIGPTTDTVAADTATTTSDTAVVDSQTEASPSEPILPDTTATSTNP
jgi:hypothetical protein